MDTLRLYLLVPFIGGCPWIVKSSASVEKVSVSQKNYFIFFYFSKSFEPLIKRQLQNQPIKNIFITNRFFSSLFFFTFSFFLLKFFIFLYLLEMVEELSLRMPYRKIYGVYLAPSMPLLMIWSPFCFRLTGYFCVDFLHNL